MTTTSGRIKLLSRLGRALLALPEPLSHALIPVVYGLARRALLRRGATMESLRLGGIPVNLYRIPAKAGAGGPPIVLIHGIADNALTWTLTAGLLRDIGPSYALDLPGFGLSGAPAGRHYATIAEHVAVVRELLARLPGPALLVGNSMGGWIGARLALLAPQEVAGLIMLDPGGAMLEGRMSWEGFRDAVAVRDMRSVRAIYRQMFGLVPLPLYLGQHGFRRLFTREAVAEFVSAVDEREFFQPDELRAIRVPTGLIWGAADRFLPAGSFEFFRDNLPDPAVLVLRGCGHMPQQERPIQVSRFIRRFVRERLTSGARLKESP